VADELEDLGRRARNSHRRRNRKNLSDNGIVYEGRTRTLRARESQAVGKYNMFAEDIIRQDHQDAESDSGARAKPTANAARNGLRSLFNTGGIFGGNAPNSNRFGFGDQPNPAVLGDDSSDDETPMKPPGVPTTPQVPQGHFDTTGFKNLGRNNKSAAADITPLEVDKAINFEHVGGLDDHINQLKEMVMLPLLYPQMYTKWKINPPRGVLFYGPPGTGKTLLARALAAQMSTNGQKVSFFMRKGADVMSKWVGEAERQLRLLFDEAKKNSPAIIFFDEFDGKLNILSLSAV
jgi:SpoVK/Ycf46/Vps4 family AAA+-type ATPase